MESLGRVEIRHFFIFNKLWSNRKPVDKLGRPAGLLVQIGFSITVLNLNFGLFLIGFSGFR
jgi:hypothetical protein